MRYNVVSGIRRAKTKLAAASMGFSAIGVSAIFALSSGAASAASGYTLSGDASVVSGGHPGQAVQLSSVGSGYGSIDYNVPAGLTLNDLNTLSTDFNATQGGCGGGSPRFSVEVTTISGPKNLFVYMGTPPNYTCSLNTWINTGNLLMPANLVDATQLGGAYYEPYSMVQANYGTDPVTGISIVVDSGWLFGTETVLIDNTMINDSLYTYDQPANPAACKNGGWMNLTDENNRPFKNQGLCVAWVNHNNGVGQDDSHAANR